MTGKRILMRTSRIVLMLLCAACAAGVARADVKIKTRQTSQGQTTENATYIKGKRARTEMSGGQMITIQQCDLRRDIQIMPQAKAYTIRPYDTSEARPAAAAATQTTSARYDATTKGGVVTSTVTTKDTGERRQMFGYTARHIITTMETKSSPDACTPMESKMETDGWYIDAAFVLDCDMERASAYRAPQPKGGCQDRYETKTIGAAKRGYAVWEKMTSFDRDGKESFSMINEVVELSQATLDASLFDAPADYREVKDFSATSETATAGADSGFSYKGPADSASSNAGPASSTAANSGMGANVKGMANASAPREAGEVGAKKPGMVRLGLAAVKTGSVGEGLSAADLSAAVENTLADYLKSPSVELVELEAKLPSQIDAEAKQKECDFVIYATVSHKKGGGGGGFGMFSKVMAPAVGQVGIGHTGSVAGNVAGQIATTAIVSAGSMSASVKQKDELTLEVKLQAPGNSTPAAAREFKSKARSAGEDIITPVVEQAAQMILDSAKL